MLQDYTHKLIPLCTQADQLFDVRVFLTQIVYHTLCTYNVHSNDRDGSGLSSTISGAQTTLGVQYHSQAFVTVVGFCTHVLHKRIKTVLKRLQSHPKCITMHYSALQCSTTITHYEWLKYDP